MGRNLAYNYIGSMDISTAEVESVCDRLGGEYKAYETIVFNLNLEARERTGVRKIYGHRSLKAAIKFHFRFCRTLSYFHHLNSK